MWISQCYKAQDFLNFLVGANKEVNLIISESLFLGFSILVL